MIFNKKPKGILPQLLFQEHMDILTKAIGYLPDEIQDFLSNHTIEIISTNKNVFSRTKSDITKLKKDDVYAIIYIPWFVWKLYDDEEIIRLILVEVAKVYLDLQSDVSDDELEQQELKLDEMVANWGFKKRDIEDTKRVKKETKEKKKKSNVKLVKSKIILREKTKS